MAAVTTHDAHAHEHAHNGHGHAPVIPYPMQLRANRIGLWMFCMSEIFLFVALLAARFYLWRDPETGVGIRPELSQTVGLITTSVLLISSYFMVRGETAIGQGDIRKFISSLWVTFWLGLLFLAGVVLIEWGLAGEAIYSAVTGHEHILRPTDGTLGAMFYAMTGMHALHVISGLILILIVIYNGRKGGYTQDRHWGVEACAIYWHYVDLVWIFFYPALYLIGQVYLLH